MVQRVGGGPVQGRTPLEHAIGDRERIHAADAHDREPGGPGRRRDRGDGVVQCKHQDTPKTNEAPDRDGPAPRRENGLRYSSGSVVSANCAGATARRLIIPSPIA